MKIAGIDIGTTGCKCSVYDENATFLCESYKEYEIITNNTEHSINPDMVFESVLEVLQNVAKTVNNISGICVTSFGEASVLVDEDDNVLMNSLLFTDPNGEEECRDFENKFGFEYTYSSTGLMPGKMYSAVKWKWIKENRPEIFKKCKHIFLFEDYIVYKLCGIRQIDYSLASRTMAFDVLNLEWNKDILDWAGVTKEQLPNLVPMGSSAAPLKSELKTKLGFENNPLIISGCHDQIAAAIGTGVLHNKMAVDGTGTVECITTVFDKKSNIDKDTLSKSGYAIVPYIKDTFVTYAFTYTGGAMLKWYRNQLSPLEAKQCESLGTSPYELYNTLTNIDHPSGLLVFPHFAGAGTPIMDKDATGTIMGLTLDTTKGQIYQGLMEGASYEMRINLDVLESSGIEVDKIYATGGGASSKEWLQIKADIYNKEVVSLGSAQSGTLGCIMFAAVACGLCTDLVDASKRFVHYEKTYMPRPNVVKEYEPLLAKYKAVHSTL